MNYYARSDETTEWLNYLQPEGLVVGPNVLRNLGLTPIRQTPLDTDAVAEVLELPSDAKREDDRFFILRDPWRFLEEVLNWPEKFVAGSPSGAAVSADLTRIVPEHETLLTPDMAVLWNGVAEEGVPAQMLVSIHPGLDPDGRGQFGDSEWEASPHQRLERLLRETGVGSGILIARNTLRLIYAPRGETAGWITWPLAALGRVEGRPMLAGLKLCLGRNAFFTGAPEKRLRPILRQSREAQNEVSEKLSGQVLGALHELLRGIHQSDPERIEALAEDESHHLYEGLLTCLMRLVFLLYAEDRDLLPSSSDPQLKTLWEGAYSVKTLYAKLLTDEALNPDTMDERRGGWGQLLAVFRIIHEGYGDWVARRGGKLFDPEVFPFLEGRGRGSATDDAKVLPISDGCILRILHGLMTVEARSLSGEKIRERLSYRALDVESIGSVYETVMGFTALRAEEQMIALRDEKKLPTFIGLDTLLAQKPNERQKWLKDNAIKLSTKQTKGVKEAADVPALLDAFGGLIDLRATPDGSAINPGTPYLQPTEERRRSGSHYTPRSLTEPIVRHALEPAFERIGPQASPEAVLSLRVCDPACGSGAFLVEACRQLGARLEQAWNMYGAEKPTIPPDEDEALHARRLVAQKCLYGVDRNPMAVDLARLSLWLATLARDHEFTFLDHALKAGDSLVGLTQREIEAANWDASKVGLPLFRSMIKDAVDKALEGREAIRNAADDVLTEAQAARFSRVQDASQPARIVGDAVIAAFFSADKAKAREMERAKVESWIGGHLQPRWDLLEAKANAFRVEQGWRPFHWEIEFPEVFARDNPGFNAIIGNPPFAGKNTISAASGARYLPWLQQLHEGAHGNADLVAHFFRRAFNLLREGGSFGLIATNTIGQGDTRVSGLAKILSQGGNIFRAIKRYQWPNEGAAVIVSIVHVGKSGKARASMLDGRQIDRISAYLVSGGFDDTPSRLVTNAKRAFIGSYLLGMGFTFDDAAAGKGEAETTSEMERLIEKDPRNSKRIKPYLGGEEVNNSPTHAHQRYAIDFEDFPLRRDPSAVYPWRQLADETQKAKLRSGVVSADYPGPVAGDWPNLLEIIERRVKPKRDRDNRESYKRYWWRFAERRAGLADSLSSTDRILVLSRISPQLGIGVTQSALVPAESLVVFAYPNLSPLAVLQSRVHEIWARFFSSSMKDDLRYAPSDCFETFPFPEGYETDETLEQVGQTYHDHRAALMIDANEGMTKTYNRFHNDEEGSTPIQRLRRLHNDMDRAVLRAYGWHDLADELRPEFLTEETEDDHTYQGRYFWNAEGRDRVLSRLLALNAERHAEEVRMGIAPKVSARSDEGNEEPEGLD
ncbi:Eco57I restriction-modification methylase domain-containing protein [Agrobacterium sp. Azo12]|uniref:Eco57I restriction-modification methylase domain-containing protein n=1 Tax=Agrobacterium sp. Azo12 TaxID=3031129 RepID=UPI0023D819C9|nr:DNA methyltransferase [Agrobacterium sp. Azo12]MDO5894052.1 N-6 DNA methylase [Agrobacterium sp. Azo12]